MTLRLSPLQDDAVKIRALAALRRLDLEAKAKAKKDIEDERDRQIRAARRSPK